MGSRQLPYECPHGRVLDWGDFGEPAAEAQDCDECERAARPLDPDRLRWYLDKLYGLMIHSWVEFGSTTALQAAMDVLEMEHDGYSVEECQAALDRKLARRNAERSE